MTDFPFAAPRPRPSRADLLRRLHALDPNSSPDASRFRAALVLLAAATVGLNIDKLSRVTALPRPFVAGCARRLVDNGVFRDGAFASPWAETGDHDRSFWNDADVAAGSLCRRITPEGEIEWAAPGEWTKRYDYVEKVPRTGLAIPYIVPDEVEPEMNGVGEVEEIDPGSEEAEDTPPNGEQPPLPWRRMPALGTLRSPRRVPSAKRAPRPRFTFNPELANQPLGGRELFPDVQWLG